ncbi:MAG: potassium transporter TrkG [Bacteroidales bacterium]|nr:potassium transporter TrkG [Bacteroidales bacterium]
MKGIYLRLILKFLGLLSMVLSAFMALSVIWALIDWDKHALRTFMLSLIIVLGAGLLLYLPNKTSDHSNISIKEGYLIVALTWLSMSFWGALPYYLSGYFSNYTDAFFESISGFTTTGASILSDIEALPRSILFWRSTTHWLGGMGIIVLTLAILPILGVGGMQLFVAEVPGTTPDKLHPHMRETAKRLWGIYLLFTILQSLLLMLGGMDFFHSINHAFSTMATGGFSTQNDSIAGYSPYIQYVIILFMILAGISFSLHYFLLRGDVKKVLNNEELKLYFGVIAIFALTLTASIHILHHIGLEEAFRQSLFQTVSIATTTGFVTTNYLEWNGSLWFLLFLLMFTGGCIGSTGGGIKMIRILIFFKNTRVELKKLIHPMAIIPVRLNKKVVPKQIITNFLAFFLTYIIVFIIGAAIMSAYGLDFESSVGASIATIGNIGPAIGSVGPAENYAHIPTGGKWVLSFFMLLGRLELFTVLLLFSPSFWKK